MWYVYCRSCRDESCLSNDVFKGKWVFIFVYDGVSLNLLGNVVVF